MNKKPNKNTYRHLINSIKISLDANGTPSDADRLSDYAIYDKLLYSRAAYLKRSKVQKQGIGQQNVQTIPCVELERADTEMCPCNPPKGCIWMKSKEPIPKIICLTSVTNSAADFTADYVEWSQFKNKLKSRSFSDKDRYYTFLDTGEGPHLYLYKEKYLANVAITGLFEDPNEAATFKGCEEKESKDKNRLLCNPLDTPLYMDADIANIVLEMALQYFATTNQASKVDDKNDNLDNAKKENNTV